MPRYVDIPRSNRLIAALSARPQILEAHLFGSRARGDASAHSDSDISVFVQEGASFSVHARCSTFGVRPQIQGQACRP